MLKAATALVSVLLLLTGPVFADGMDLPVAPVKFGDPPSSEPPEPEPVEEDPLEDPRDSPAPVFYGEEIETQGDTLIYVLDVSCSMAWGVSQAYETFDGQTAHGSKLDRAKAELEKSIRGLAPNFAFNIVAYSCNLLRWASSLQEASDPNKSAATAWARSLQATSSTATGPAVALALQDRTNFSVVLLTDGEPNCGADGCHGHRQMIAAANTHGATISVFGISASGGYRLFCQQVASDSGGTYMDIP